MSAVAKTEEQQQPAVISDAAGILAVIERAAMNPQIDVEKMERLLAMQERILERNAKAAFTAALAEMQPLLPTIDQNGAIKNNAGTVQSTYAEWEDINDAIRPLLHDHGFALSFKPGMATDGKVTMTGVLRHRDGFEEEATVTLPHDSSGSKNSVQAVGSSLSYGKRYAAIALLNITSRAPRDRDDDGQRSNLSAAAEKAFTDINMAEGLEELRAWKNKNYDGLSKLLSADELRDVIALYNRRVKAAKGQASDQ
jgi:hypothetical protein